MSSPPGQTQSPTAELQSPPIENFLATVLLLRDIVWPSSELKELFMR